MTEKRKREKKGKNHFYSISSRCFLHTPKIAKIKREKREKSFPQYLSEGALLTSKSLRKKKRKKRKNPKNILLPSPVAFLLLSEIPRVFFYNSYSDRKSSHLCYTDTSQRTSRHICNFGVSFWYMNEIKSGEYFCDCLSQGSSLLYNPFSFSF